MHPEISSYSNEIFYEKKLKPIPLKHQLENTSLSLFTTNLTAYKILSPLTDWHLSYQKETRTPYPIQNEQR